MKAGGNQNKTSGVETSGDMVERKKVTVEEVEDLEDKRSLEKNKQVRLDPAPQGHTDPAGGSTMRTERLL